MAAFRQFFDPAVYFSFFKAPVATQLERRNVLVLEQLVYGGDVKVKVSRHFRDGQISAKLSPPFFIENYSRRRVPFSGFAFNTGLTR